MVLVRFAELPIGEVKEKTGRSEDRKQVRSSGIRNRGKQAENKKEVRTESRKKKVF